MTTKVMGGKRDGAGRPREMANRIQRAFYIDREQDEWLDSMAREGNQSKSQVLRNIITNVRLLDMVRAPSGKARERKL